MNDALKKIKDSAKRVQGDIKKRKKPSLQLPLRSLSNVRYDPKTGFFQMGRKRKERTLTYNTVKTFAQTMRVAAVSKDLIERDEIATKREVYYIAKGWDAARFDEQAESDAVLDDVEAFLGVNREQLGFIPEEKGGEVAGRLVIVDEDARGRTLRIDCTRFGSGAYSIPISVERLGFETRAKFVLVVETAGMFQRLVKHDYWDTANCIIVSMGGVPTRACRRFVRRLADEHNLPVYAFTDGDPYGYMNIYRTLKVGSGNNAHLNEFFCVPQARFLGVTPQDIEDYDLPTHPLQDVDVKRAQVALKNDPFVQHYKQWQEALQRMIEMGVRVEQQAFAAHGLNYVLETYLPEKLAHVGRFLP